jgi:hypothetical protein
MDSREKEVLLARATTERRGPCQVRSKTDHPCPHRAAVEIRGVPFCEPCAREQEAYFAVGELTLEAQGFRSEPLVGALGGTRRERAGGIGAAEEPEAISKRLGVPALIGDDVH